ncbi:MAG: hypothetical protein JW869_01470 [Candidatus Omnitrophica bacterium]|nr:hypothetical protein [Candidatus Omnitrophota bacterium]
MKAKNLIWLCAVGVLFFCCFCPAYFCYGQGSLTERLEEATQMKNRSGVSSQPAPAQSPASPASSDATQPAQERDEFYPGQTITQLTDPDTGNTKSLVKMPDGTLKLMEKDDKGKIISEMELSRDQADMVLLEEDGLTTEMTKLPDGRTQVKQYDEDGNLISSETLPYKDKMASASSYDPQARTTTTVRRNEDGSKTITQTDEDGFVLSEETISPEDEKATYASSYDRDAGITTTCRKNTDGTHDITHSKSWQDSDGSDHVMEVDSAGNKTETITTAEGVTTIKKTNPEGNSIATTRYDDGTVRTVEQAPEGNIVETTTTAAGHTYRVAKDPQGNTTGSITQYNDGSSMMVDSEKGNKVEVSAVADDGTRTVVVTDKEGNQVITTVDEENNVISADEKWVTPPEAGERYYRNVLGGEDWDSLPDSTKSQYGNSERSLIEKNQMQALRDQQQLERQAQEEADRQWQLQQQQQLEERLAQLEQDEMKRAQKLQEQQTARDERRKLELERLEAQTKASELQQQLDWAYNTGDQEEITRLENLMDEHHDQTAHLFEFTEDEKAQAERYQQVRDQVHQEISFMAESYGGTDARARVEREIEAASAKDSWGEASLRELSFTGMTVDMVDEDMVYQQGVKVRADNKVIAAQQYLQREDLTDQQRRAAEQILEVALMERENADSAIGYDKMIIAAGAGSDLLAAGVGSAGARATRALFPKLFPNMSRRLAQSVPRLAPAPPTPPSGAASAQAAREAAAALSPEETPGISQPATSTAGREATGVSQHATTIMESPEAIADDAFRLQETDVMRPSETQGSSVRKGASAFDEEFRIDLDTEEGIRALEEREARMDAEIAELRAEGKKLTIDPDHMYLFEPELLERPGFKNVPETTPAELPSMAEHLTPEQAAKAEAETVITRAVEPKTQSSGAKSAKVPETELEIQLLDSKGRPITDAQLRELEVAGQKLDAALQRRYANTNEKMPPMHVLDQEAFNAVKADGKLTTGDINFSAEGVGPSRRGGEAVKVKKGFENKIHFIERGPDGWGVKYFKNGKKYLPDGKTVDLSQGQDYIPLDMLQYFDKATGKWVDF